MDTSVLWQISYGLYGIGVLDEGRPTGCIVNTVIQITSANPSLALSLNKDNYTCDVLKENGHFAISILAEGVSPIVIGKLGFATGRSVDKFSAFPYEMWEGAPIVKEGSTGYLLCDLLSMTETETHMVLLARVLDAKKGGGGIPLTYKYYHEVIKGKAPKNAPTYQAPEAEKEKVVYVCPICGYEYQGDITREPDDYTCPICGVSKDKFTLK